MKNKIIGMILIFLVAVGLSINVSNAIQRLDELEHIAANNLDQFLTMNIEMVATGHYGNDDSAKRAWYCLHEQSNANGGNKNNMRTAVVDIGRTSLNSVEGVSSSYGSRNLSTANPGADLATQIVYLAAKSYINGEPWRGQEKAPYRHAMIYYASLYANTVKAVGLFNEGLDYNTAHKEEHISGYNSWAITEAQNYVNATKNFSFADQSKKDAQTIIEDGGWTFVGPYRIQKEGANSGGITSWISSIAVEGENGATYTPNGWATSANANSVNGNNELPNGQDFYLAFKTNKPDAVKKVTVKRAVSGVLRARFVFCDSDGGQDIGIYGGTFSTGSTEYAITLPGVPYSSIKITKKDERTGAKLTDDVQFIAYLQGAGYVKNNNYTQNKNDATVFTSKNGVVTINNLSKTGKYIIYEIGNKNEGYLEVSIDKPIQLKEVTVERIGQVVTDEATNKPVIDFQLSKIDQDSKKEMPNVGFVIRYEPTGEYVINGKFGEEATYTRNINQATTFMTGDTVNNIPRTGKYIIYEVINPHFGYQEVSYSNPLKVGEYDVTKMGVEAGTGKVTITAKNKRIYVKLSGYVWEDMISQKTSIRNYLWHENANDEEDKRVRNVKVTLKKADGTVIDTRTTNTITNTRGETEEGAYLFGDYQRDPSAKKILIDDLEGATIEFEYNGMRYQSVEVKTLIDNGSKATDQKVRDSFNNKFATIVNNQAVNANNNNNPLDLSYTRGDYVSTLQYGGTYQYGYDGQKYPISGIEDKYLIIANTKDAAQNQLLGQRITIQDILNQGLEEIPNINLGLYEREMPDLRVGEDLEKAEVTLNRYNHIYQNPNADYQHTYLYNQYYEQGTDKFNVTVQFEKDQGKTPYTREIYSSDVVYNEQNANTLQIYLTYKIALINEATTVYTKVNEMVNYFDSRYEVVSVTDSNGNELEKEVTNYNNEYKKVRIYNMNQDIVPLQDSNNENHIFIRFKLNNDAINSLLNQDATLNSISEITSYSSYSDKGFGEHYAGIDKDSNPGNAIPGDKTTYEDDTNSAPSLILQATETREIKGTVWQDNAIQDLLDKEGYEKERKGDGRYTQEDNVVGNVTVELLDLGADKNIETATVATLYKKDKTTQEARTTTNQSGDYEFSGVIPGNYLVRYTYGDTSVIYDTQGNKIEEVKAENYKSTIYRDGKKESAETMDDYWYRGETGDSTRLSDAKDETGIYQDGTRVDIVEKRNTEETINYKNAKNETTLTNIEADTRNFNIKLEYDINLDNISQYGADLKCVFDNIDLGIIKRPEQNVDIRKEISHVEVVLANGQIVIAGDPREGTINHLKILPDGNIHVELDNELIQGATLNVEYEIIVDNTKAEIDYNNQDYYIYGTVPRNYTGWKLATVTKMIDYLSNGLNFNEQNATNGIWQQVNIEQQLVEDGVLSQEAFEIAKTYNKVLQTDYFKDMTPGNVKTAKMVVSRLLSNNANDYTFDNDIEVIELTGRKIKDSIPGNYVPGDSLTSENDDDNKMITITGPTGEDNNYLPYIMLGISCLAILGAGIIFIIKKVLRK